MGYFDHTLGTEVPLSAVALGACVRAKRLTLDRVFLAGKSFYASYAHQDEHVESYLNSVAEVFCDLATAIESEDLRGRLRGSVAHSGFRRLT